MDSPAEDLVLKLGEDFLSRVVGMACEAASARNSRSLEIEDIKLILESYWSIRVPEYERDDDFRFDKNSAAKLRREQLARKHKTRKTERD